jgi:hypothetical protein
VKHLAGVTKEKLILFGLPAFGLLLGLLGYVALVLPQKSKASHLSAEVDAARAGQVVPAKPKTESKPPSVHAADIFRLTKAMPDSADVPGVLLELARVAGESSVAVQSVKPSSPVALPAGYGVIPLDVTVQGTFPHVSAFLQRLRGEVSVDARGTPHVSGRLLVADQVGLASGDGRTVTATLSFNAFVYGMTPPAPAPTTTDTTDTTTTAASGSTG